MNFANKTLEHINLNKELGFVLPEKTEPTVGIFTSNLGGKFRNRDPVNVNDLTLEPYSGIVIKYKG